MMNLPDRTRRKSATAPPQLTRLFQQLTLPRENGCPGNELQPTQPTARLTTFSLFPDLPVEIQIKIWHMSWESRAINLEPISILRGQSPPPNPKLRAIVSRPLVFDLQFFRSKGREAKSRIAKKKARHAEAHNHDLTANLIIPEGWYLPPLPASLYIKGIAHAETLRCYQPLTFAPGTVLASHFWIRRNIRVNLQLDQVKLGGWAANWTMCRPQPTFYHYETNFPSLKPFISQALTQGPWSALRHIVVDGLFFHGLVYLEHARAYPRPMTGTPESMYVDYRPTLPSRGGSFADTPGGVFGNDIIDLIEESASLETFTISLSDRDFDKWVCRHGRALPEPAQSSMAKAWGTAHKIRLARCRPSDAVLMLGERKYSHPWAIFILAPFPRAGPERVRFKRLLGDHRLRKWPSAQMGILSKLSHNLAQPGWHSCAELWGRSLLADWHVLLSFWVSGGYKNPCRLFYTLESVRLRIEKDNFTMHPAWMLPPIHGICAEDYGL